MIWVHPNIGGTFQRLNLERVLFGHREMLSASPLKRRLMIERVDRTEKNLGSEADKVSLFSHFITS